jgi:hypothetical protein
MSVLKPRNRLVNFRLSEEEFQSMKNACERSGARSLSDFARGAVLAAMEQLQQGGGFKADASLGPLSRLDQAVESLHARVDQLISTLSEWQHDKAANNGNDSSHS